MSTLRAKVIDGRVHLDEPTTLPEGTILELVVDDGGDDLGPAERAARDAAIARGFAQAQAGEGRPATDLLAELRGRK